MATRKEFCEEMEKVYTGHGVYIGAANGEKTEDMTFKRVKQLEDSYEGRDHNSDIQRDLAYIGKCYGKGWNMSGSYAGDCSGQVVGALRRLGVISSTADYNCRSYQESAEEIELKDLQPGDLVFNKKMTYNKDKKKYVSSASHMGVVVAIENGMPMVVESRGRDVGVVREPVSNGGWVIGGRLDWFDPDYPPLTRNLYYIKGDRMTGEDVLRCKEKLCEVGCLKEKYVDDIFGKHTDEATRKFQEEHGLTVDGIIGQKTYKALMEA